MRHGKANSGVDGDSRWKALPNQLLPRLQHQQVINQTLKKINPVAGSKIANMVLCAGEGLTRGGAKYKTNPREPM